MNSHHYERKDWLEWVRKNCEDIESVISSIERDAKGVEYMVLVSLKSLTKSAYEEGESRQVIWRKRVNFGRISSLKVGGYAFFQAAQEQEKIAELISENLQRKSI